MLDSELTNYILRVYPQIEDILSVEPVTEGYLSNNHILHTKEGKYFLKQYAKGFKEEEVDVIHQAINFFSKKGIPSISAIKDSKGDAYFIFHSRIYSIFPFVTGICADRDNISKDSITSLAKTLAQIHILSSKGIALEISKEEKGIDREGFLDSYPKIMDIITSKEELDEFDELALKSLKLKKSIVDNNKEKTESYELKKDHLLHGDFHEKNVFLDNNQEVKFVFDWEKTKIGCRLYELIRSMDYIFLDGEYGNDRFEKAKLYLETYNQIYPFNRKDFINTLEGYFLKKAHSLWIERTHYLEKSDRVDCFLELQVAFLEYYPRNYKTLIEKLGV